MNRQLGAEFSLVTGLSVLRCQCVKSWNLLLSFDVAVCFSVLSSKNFAIVIFVLQIRPGVKLPIAWIRTLGTKIRDPLDDSRTRHQTYATVSLDRKRKTHICSTAWFSLATQAQEFIQNQRSKRIHELALQCKSLHKLKCLRRSQVKTWWLASYQHNVRERKRRNLSVSPRNLWLLMVLKVVLQSNCTTKRFYINIKHLCARPLTLP